MTGVGEWRKGRKRTRTPGGKVKDRTPKKKHGKHSCALCEAVLHGTPHGRSRAEVLSMHKTKRRPTAVYAGVLCAECRSMVVEEAAKVDSEFKELSEVSYRMRPYVEGIMKRVIG